LRGFGKSKGASEGMRIQGGRPWKGAIRGEVSKRRG